MAQQILTSAEQSLRVIAEHADPSVARTAQYAADNSGHMIVINVRTAHARWLKRAAADRAQSALRCPHGRVLLRREAIGQVGGRQPRGLRHVVHGGTVLHRVLRVAVLQPSAVVASAPAAPVDRRSPAFTDDALHIGHFTWQCVSVSGSAAGRSVIGPRVNDLGRFGMRVRTVAGIVATAAALAGIVVTAPRMPAQAAVRKGQPACGRELAAYREVSRQAGVTLGSVTVGRGRWHERGLWARELRRAGDPALAATARGVTSVRGAEEFTLALTASADAALQGGGCDGAARFVIAPAAPRKVCRAALGEAACFWYAGPRATVVFDLRVRAVTS